MEKDVMKAQAHSGAAGIAIVVRDGLMRCSRCPFTYRY